MSRISVFLLVIFALLAPAPLLAQSPAPNNGVGPVIDPTKNVLDLVQAAIKRQDDLREAESKLQVAMREAEMKRINELSVQKQLFDLELARILRANADGQALLLATQLKEVKNDVSDRVSKLEQFRWETGGKTSGQGETVAWIMTGVMALIALTGTATAIVVAVRRKTP